MTSFGRKLGVNILTLMYESGISREDLAKKINYTYRDMCRVLEGKILLPPVEIEKIAKSLGKSKEEIINYKPNKYIPELRYMENFSNIDKVLDLIDEYIELREAI